ncbi:MarR family winged helix-turn-helix transcriptional regulator [Micromonospora sonneratiae]|uniref:MarR family winged helix-turn-helix transcriptional regulator n=1 Tax=Micromonospora sonneratiae TaxID=1184706 RepID=A0ABW3YCH6_9ACTN
MPPSTSASSAAGEDPVHAAEEKVTGGTPNGDTRPTGDMPNGDTSPTGKGLHNDLGWALGVVFRSYVKAADAVVSDLPGGPRGYQVLASAAQGLAGNQGVLAHRLGIDRTVLTYLIDDLEEIGLVERRPDPADRRSRQVIATEQGRTLWAQRQEALDHLEQHVLGALGDDAPTFRTLLQRLAAHANELDPLVDTCQVVEQLTAADRARPVTATNRPRRGGTRTRGN